MGQPLTLKCPLRMRSALKALMDNPQNNLAMFKDGKKIYGEGQEMDLKEILANLFRFRTNSSSSSSTDDYVNDLLDIMVKILQSVPSNKAHTSDQHSPQSCQCNEADEKTDLHIRDGLNKNCVLGRILSLQKQDTMDVEGIFPLFQEIMAHKSCWTEENLWKWLYGRMDESMEPVTDWKELNSSLKDSILKVRNFLVAATMKDCSVMITFQELADNVTTVPSGFVIKNLRGVHYLFSTAILDLDMKPVDRIPKYLQDERKLVTLFESQLHDTFD